MQFDIFDDKEFQDLDYAKKKKIAMSYFNNDLADDEFRQLDHAKQNKIISSYLKDNIGEVSTTKTALHSAEENLLPSLGGVATFMPGFEVGAAVGAMTGPAAPIAAPVLGIAGGIATSMAGAEGVRYAQDKLLEHYPEAAKYLGLDKENRQLEKEAHPYVDLAAGLAPLALAFKPSLKGIPTINGAIGGALGGGLEAGNEYFGGQEIDPYKIGISAAGGALLNNPTAIGNKLNSFGEKISPFSTAKPQEQVTPQDNTEVATNGFNSAVDNLNKQFELNPQMADEILAKPISQIVSEIRQARANEMSKTEEVSPTLDNSLDIKPQQEPINTETPKYNLDAINEFEGLTKANGLNSSDVLQLDKTTNTQGIRNAISRYENGTATERDHQVLGAIDNFMTHEGDNFRAKVNQEKYKPQNEVSDKDYFMNDYLNAIVKQKEIEKQLKDMGFKSKDGAKWTGPKNMDAETASQTVKDLYNSLPKIDTKRVYAYADKNDDLPTYRQLIRDMSIEDIKKYQSSKKEILPTDLKEQGFKQLDNGDIVDGNGKLLFSKKQAEETKDLIVQHNLSEGNLKYVKQNDGISVPSLAITKGKTPLTGFGEITLLGDKELANPKGYAKTKVFGADIYSPRHPKETREYKSVDIRKLDKELEPYSKKLQDGSINDSRDVQDLIDNKAMQMKFLEEQKGIKLEIPTKKNPNEDIISKYYPDEYNYSLQNKGIDWLSLYKNDSFKQKVVADLKAKFAERGKDLDPIVAYGEDGIINIARERAQAIDQIGRSQGKPDYYAMREILKKEIDKHRGEFENYVNDFQNKHDYKSYFYDNGKKKKFDEQTILKYLTANLRGGEGYNYGSGNIRAMVTPEFKTLEQIKAAKDKLTTPEQFEPIKDSINNELLDIASSIASKNGNQFMANDIAMEFIQDYAKRGKRAIPDYDVNVNTESLKRIDEFLNKLKEMPTEYFEAKITRKVQPSEFNTAVVPEDISKESLEYLAKQGLNIKTYKRGDEADRARAIQEATKEYDLLFSKFKQKDSTTVEEAINQTKKLLGKKFDDVTKDVEFVQSLEHLPQEIKDALHSITAYHGTPHDVDSFSTKHIGSGEGNQAYGWGMYFADSKKVAEWYKKNLQGLKNEYKPKGYDVGEWWNQAKELYPNNKEKQEAWHILAQGDFSEGKNKLIEWGEENAYSEASRKEIRNVANQIYGEGNLYKVELKPNEDEYLHWDKPLSEQSEHVQNVLSEKLANSRVTQEYKIISREDYYEVQKNGKKDETFETRRDAQDYIDERVNGEGIYKHISSTLNDKSGEKTSKLLNELGIKGIKYLDNTSRGHDQIKELIRYENTIKELQQEVDKWKGKDKDNEAYYQKKLDEVKKEMSDKLQHNYVIFKDENVGKPEILKSGGVPRGVFDPQTNKVYLIADTMKANEVQGVLLHELLHRAINGNIKEGQSRLETIMGSNLNPLVNQMYRLASQGDKTVLNAIKRVKEANTSKNNQTEETLSYLLENHTNDKNNSTALNRWIKDTLEAIKNYIRKVATSYGIEPNWFISRMNADDIASVLKDVAIGNHNVSTKDKPLFSKANSRLEEWHKYSSPLTKNEDGSPKVFYHGTSADFNAFDIEKSNVGNFGTGFYFSPSAEHVNKHFANKPKSNIMPVYLKAENLFDMTKINTQVAEDYISSIGMNDFKPNYDLRPFLFYKSLFNLKGTQHFKEFLENKGYDSIIAKSPAAGEQILVFNPTQIKSVNNRGTFDKDNPNILYSKAEEQEQRATLKDKIKEHYSKTALERTNEALKEFKDEEFGEFKSLFKNTLPQNYDNAYVEMNRNKNAIMRQVGIMVEALKELTPEQDKMLYDYANGRIKEISPELKAIAEKATSTIKEMGRVLVAEGGLPKEVVEAWEGKYLHIQYAKDQTVMGRLKAITKSKTIPKQFTRGLEETFSKDAKGVNFINKYLEAFGHEPLKADTMAKAVFELKDRNLLAKEDNPQWKSEGLIKISHEDGKYTISRDYSTTERERMGEITKASIAIPNTIMRMTILLEHTKFLKNVSENVGEKFITEDKEFARANNFKQLPNYPKYGALAGKFVRKDIYRDIEGVYSDIERGGLYDSWLKYLSLWKASKTVFNPAAHFNNFSSNMFIKYGLGISPLDKMETSRKVLKALEQYEQLEVKEAKGTLTDSEVKRMESLKADKYFQMGMELRDAGNLGKSQLLDIKRGFEKEGVQEESNNPLVKGVKGVAKKAEDLYQYEDVINRLSAYIAMKDKGLETKDAMNIIDKLFPDYSKPMPTAWRVLRDSGISPFISWSYYTLPSIAKIMKANPERALGAFGMVAALSFASTLASTVYNGGTTEDAVKAFLNIPEDAIGRRIPIYSNGKETTTLKVDRIIPGMDLVAPLIGGITGAYQGYRESHEIGHTAMKSLQGAYTGLGNTVRSYVGGPTVNAMAFNTIGKDSYTGNDIVNKDASDKMRLWQSFKYVIETYSPVPTPLMRAVDIAEGQVLGKDERKKNQVTVPRDTMQNIAGFAGINLLSYDQKEFEKQMKDFSSEAQTFRSIAQDSKKVNDLITDAAKKGDSLELKRLMDKHKDELKTIQDWKKTQEVLSKMKQARDNAYNKDDDRQVLEINEKMNKVMKDFNERNKK